MGDFAPHHAGVGFDGKHIAKSDTAEDPLVGFMGALVVFFQILLIGVEAVGIFHGEFPGADQSGTGTGFVTVFGLDLIEHHRQLLVAVDFAAHQCGDALLMGHGKEHILVVAVFEAEEFGTNAFKASGLFPQFGGQHHGHQDLLTVDLVHFLADNGFNAFDDLFPCGQQRVDTGGNRTDISAPDQKLMTGCFGIFRHFFQAAPHHLAHLHLRGSPF